LKIDTDRGIGISARLDILRFGARRARLQHQRDEHVDGIQNAQFNTRTRAPSATHICAPTPEWD
jgi:hypothetical protein